MTFFSTFAIWSPTTVLKLNCFTDILQEFCLDFKKRWISFLNFKDTILQKVFQKRFKCSILEDEENLFIGDRNGANLPTAIINSYSHTVILQIFTCQWQTHKCKKWKVLLNPNQDSGGVKFYLPPSLLVLP